MTWLRILLVTVISGAILGTAVDARAQAPGQTAPAGQQAKRERIKQRILAMRAALLTTELQLDEQTAAKLFPVLSKYDDRFVALLRDNADLRKQAQDAYQRGDDKALDALIDKIVANQRARWDTEAARFADVRKVLTPQQAARIFVVLPQIDRRIQNQLRRALGGGAGGGGRRRGRGAGAQPDDTGSGDDDLDDGPFQ